MRKNARLLVILLVIGTFIGFSGAALAAEKKPIKIAVATWPGWCHVFLAKEKGFFERNGVDVDLIHIPEYLDSKRLFLAGEVDGSFQALTDTIIQNEEIDSKVVYVTDYSFTGDVIVGNVDKLSDLKGKVVGVEGINTFSHLFVLKMLEKAGLEEHDVTFKIVDAHKVLEALEKGRIDAGHTWEPTKSAAIEEGYNVLAVAGDIPGIITDLLVFHAKVIEERPQDIQAIVKSLVEAQEYRDSHWTESIKLMADAVDISYSSMESGLLGTHQLDLQGNVDIMAGEDAPDSLRASCNLISSFYMKRGQLPVPPKCDEIIEPKFVNALAQELKK